MGMVSIAAQVVNVLLLIGRITHRNLTLRDGSKICRCCRTR